MKDHPGWIVGTLYGEPVYQTIEPNEMPDLATPHFYGGRPITSALEYVWPDRWD